MIDMQQTKGQRHMQEFTDSLYVPELIQALQEYPQSYKVVVMGCDGIGVHDITQIIPDERGFIELWTFNSRSCELGASDDPLCE